MSRSLFKSLLSTLGVALLCGSSAFAQMVSLHRSTSDSACSRYKPQELQSQTEELLNWKASPAFRVIKEFFPDAQQDDFKTIKIQIQNFGENKLYRGFFTPGTNPGTGVIQLDCKLGSVLSWPSLLAHELSHVLSDSRHLSSWMQELLGQLIEVNATPYYNFSKLEVLRNLSQIPSFFSDDKPFRNHQTYAANMMFGLYISQNFGGSNVFKELNRDVQTLQDFSKKLSRFTVGKGEFDWIRKSINPANLIRYFALAMNTNMLTRNRGTLYQIPGWSGFSKDSLITEPGAYAIEPGGFLRLHPRYWAKFQKLMTDHELPDDLSLYQVHKNDTDFYIQESSAMPKDFVATESVVVLINTSLDQNFVVELDP